MKKSISFNFNNKRDNFSNTFYSNRNTFYQTNNSFYKKRDFIVGQNNLNNEKKIEKNNLRKLLLLNPKSLKDLKYNNNLKIDFPNFDNEKLQKEITLNLNSHNIFNNNNNTSLISLSYSLMNKNKSINKINTNKETKIEKKNKNSYKKEKVLYLKLNKNDFSGKNENKNIFRKLKKYKDKKEINKISINDINSQNNNIERNKNNKILEILKINNNEDLNKKNDNFDFDTNNINNINNKKVIKINKYKKLPLKKLECVDKYKMNLNKLSFCDSIIKKIEDFEKKVIDDYIKNNNKFVQSERNENKMDKQDFLDKINNKFKKEKTINYHYFNNIIDNLTRNINLIDVSSEKDIQLKLLRNIEPTIEKNININASTQKNHEKKIYSYNDDFASPKIDKDKNTKRASSITSKRYINLTTHKYLKNFFINNKNNHKNNSNKNDVDKKNNEEKNEDLNLFGKKNKLNWSKISDKDKEMGLRLWNNILNSNSNIVNNTFETEKIEKEGKIIAELNIVSKPIEEKEQNSKNIKQIINLSPDVKNENYLSMTEIIKKKSLKTLNNKKNKNKRIIYTPYHQNKNNNIIIDSNKKNEIKSLIIKTQNKIYNENSSNNSYKKNGTIRIKNKNNNKDNIFLSPLKYKLNLKIRKALSEKKIKKKKQIIYGKSKKLKNEINSNINANKNSERKKVENNQELKLIIKKDKHVKFNSKNININKNKNRNNYSNANTINTITSNSLYQKNKSINITISKNNSELILNERHSHTLEPKEEKNILMNKFKFKRRKSSKKIKKKEKKKENSEEKEEKNSENDSEKENKEENSEEIFERKKIYKKTKKRNSITYNKFLKDMNKALKEEKEINDIKMENKKKMRKYFHEINLNSLVDINNKKLEIMFKMKHDLEYKIRKGDIKPGEKDEYKKLEERINMLSDCSLENLNTSDYIDILEDYFSSFESNMYLAEQKKKDEERINGFKGELQQNLYFYFLLKKKIEEKFGHPIDFKTVNHINELNNI